MPLMRCVSNTVKTSVSSGVTWNSQSRALGNLYCYAELIASSIVVNTTESSEKPHFASYRPEDVHNGWLGWVGLGGWLNTKTYAGGHDHFGTLPGRCRVTSLSAYNAKLPLSHTGVLQEFTVETDIILPWFDVELSPCISVPSSFTFVRPLLYPFTPVAVSPPFINIADVLNCSDAVQYNSADMCWLTAKNNFYSKCNLVNNVI